MMESSSIPVRAGHPPHIERPRRIVTGHDDDGNSIIWKDGPCPVLIQPAEAPAFAIAEIWRSESVPCDNSGEVDGALLPFALEPSSNGLICRVVEFPPDQDLDWTADAAEKVFDSLKGGNAISGRAQRHPAFHRTVTQDFAIVLSGEIWALLDVGETKMAAGDILVQRGTNHAWSNRSDKPCRVCFIGVAARPL